MTDSSTSSHLPRRGGQRADRNADGRRAVVDSGELGTRPKKRKMRPWMLPIVTRRRASPRAAVLQAPSRRQRARDAGRRRRGVPDASGCFLWSYRALFIRELGVREDQTARAPLELRRMTWLSPQQVLARCLAPDIEALTSAPAFQRSYWSHQHAPLVPRGVGRQQCPHPCFLPCRNWSRQRYFAALAMRARRGGRPALRVSTGNVIRAIEEWLSRAPPPRRRARLQRETTPTAGRGLRAAIHA